MDKIGFLGGSFNPIHNGHLKIANVAKSALGLQEVWFIPTFVHPFKGKIKSVTNEDRCAMIENSIQSFPSFKLKTHEIDHELTYTIDSVRWIKEHHPNHEIYLIIGADNLKEFHKWKSYQELLDLVKLVVFSRNNIDLSKYNVSNLHAIKLEPIAISSTEIRELIKSKNDVKNMLPQSVFNYIETNNLYQE